MGIKKGTVTLLATVILSLTMTQAFATPADTYQELQSSRREANQVNEEIRQIAVKVIKAEDELSKVSEELDQLNEEIELNIENLEAAEKNLAEKTQEFNQRLREMYKNGNIGYMEVLLTAQNLSDLLSRNNMLKQIANDDKELIAFIQEDRDFIEEKKKELEIQRDTVEEMKDKIEERKADLEKTNAEKQALLSRLQIDIATFESRYNQMISERRATSPSRGNTSRNNGSGGSTAANSNSTTNNNTQTETVSATPAPTPAPSNGSVGSQIAATAMKFRGYKYVYGGTTPSGFDCSGFTSYVYRQYGISLPRTSGGQGAAGRSVSRSEIQAGDILAFPGHVGIYIGNGNMVHASNPTRGVVVDNVFSGYYSGRLISIRRPY